MLKKVSLVLLIIFAFLSSFFVAYAWGMYKRIYVPKNLGGLVNTIPGSPTPTPDPLAPRSLAILGYGGAGHEGGALTDTMIVAHIDPRQNKVILISIPRDIWVELPLKDDSSEFRKINHAYAIGIDDRNYPNKKEIYKGLAGGGRLAEDVLTKVTGLKVDNYVSVNFSGFKRIVDVLGGVTVKVPYPFEDNYYPITGMEKDPCGKTDEDIKALTATMSGELLEKEFPCRYETLKFRSGSQNLDSETALKFVRSRHSSSYGNDFGRSMRQQAFLVGVKNKLLNIKNLPKTLQILDSLSKNVLTDLDISQIIKLLPNEGIKDVTISSISLTTDNVLIESTSSDRQYILVPKAGEGNFEEIHKFIESEIGKTYSN